MTAFKDIHPLAPVHILIVPNKEIATVDDVTRSDEALLGHMFVVAKQIARDQGISESGYRLLINCKATPGRRSFTCTCICSAGAISVRCWRNEINQIG